MEIGWRAFPNTRPLQPLSDPLARRPSPAACCLYLLHGGPTLSGRGATGEEVAAGTTEEGRKGGAHGAREGSATTEAGVDDESCVNYDTQKDCRIGGSKRTTRKVCV